MLLLKKGFDYINRCILRNVFPLQIATKQHEDLVSPTKITIQTENKLGFQTGSAVMCSQFAVKKKKMYNTINCE